MLIVSLYKINANWFMQKEPEEGVVYTCLNAINENVVYAFGNHNIVKTNNGGETWHTIPLDSTKQWCTIDFTSELIGWAIADSGHIQKTIDGGDSWIDYSSKFDSFDSIKSFNSISFVNDSVGWLSDEDIKPSYYPKSNSNFFTTKDGGETWTRIPLTLDSMKITSIVELQFVNKSDGYMVTNCVKPDDGFNDYSTRVYITGDGGFSWDRINGANNIMTSYDEGFYKLYALDEKNAWYSFYSGIGKYPPRWFTYINGESKNDSDITYFEYSQEATAINFINKENGFYCWSNFVLRTYDGGNTWIEINNFRCNSIDFVTDKIGWAAGEGIYKTTDMGDTTDLIIQNVDNMNKKYQLSHQKSGVKIEIAVQGIESHSCQLSIYSLNGRLIYSNTDPLREDKKVTFSIADSKLSSGCYLLKVKSSAFEIKQVMTLR